MTDNCRDPNVYNDPGGSISCARVAMGDNELLFTKISAHGRRATRGGRGH